MYSWMAQESRGPVIHWTKYIKANFTKGVHYRTNKNGEINWMTPECSMHIMDKMGTPEAMDAKDNMRRTVQFNEDQKYAMYSLD